MPDFDAAFDALGKLVDKVGPWDATLMVTVIALAVTCPKWLEVLRHWAKDRADSRLEWAKFTYSKTQRDVALREHGKLTIEALHPLMRKPHKRGETGVDDHG